MFNCGMVRVTLRDGEYDVAALLEKYR